MLRTLFIALLSLYLASCASTPPAPVIDKAAKPTASTKSAAVADWRPSTYTVKKGDTLFAIGLEFGYDYKEIAEANNIKPPYQINIGRTLMLPNSANTSASTNTNTGETKADTNENEVVVTPITTDSVVTEAKVGTPNATAATTVPAMLSQPKAIREPYSIEALNRPTPVEAKEVAKTASPSANAAAASTTATGATTGVTNVIKPPVTGAKPVNEVGMQWIWPTKGKVVSGFNESANKGIDIAGTTGQAILAASGGKVIYSGSDLRGYGKLIIIKHNKTFLSIYAHNSKILVKEGQLVSSGQKIAEMGNTDSNTVKLHFEIRRQGKSVDPAPYLTHN